MLIVSYEETRTECESMTPNRRIFWNIAASYGRSLFSIACGLFSTRWVLMALGQTDMGLYSVIGGLTIFIMFFNIQFASAVSRYFAYSIGKANVSEEVEAGLDECRRWFNVAFFIHTILPLTMVAIGYPVGEYAITHEWLEIPADRVRACVWVWRFTCISCLVGMMNVPFQAMFTAKQFIAELTVYSVAQTAIKTLFIYFMVVYPGDWLARYAFAMMLIAVIPSVMICARAIQVFPECRFQFGRMWDWSRIKQLFAYVTWQVVGSAGFVLRTTGVSILVNKTMGPKVNAAMSIGTTLSAETSLLSGALSNAFGPVIATACGAGDFEQMRAMAFRACKFGLALTLVFALPLALEVDEVLRLWLKSPPLFASEFCLCLLVCVVLDKATLGHVMAINASGRLAKFQSVHGFSLMMALPVAGVFYYLVPGIWSIGGALVGTMAFSVLCDVWVARTIVGMSARYWFAHIICPIGILVIASLLAGFIPSFFMSASFLRILITTFCTFSSFLVVGWLFVLSEDERRFIHGKWVGLFNGWR